MTHLHRSIVVRSEHNHLDSDICNADVGQDLSILKVDLPSHYNPNVNK